MSQPRFGRRRALVAFAMASALAVLSVAPASATMFVRERYHDTDAFSYDDCGPVVDVTVEFGGRFQVRTGTGKDAGAFFAHDRYWWHETHVSEDGRTYTVAGDGIFQETRATRIEGTIFQFVAIDAGKLFTIRDADGDVVVRDRGRISQSILFDVTDDGVPGGIFIEELWWDPKGVFESLDFDFCSLWAD